MISVDGISKTFRLYRRPADRLREIILRKPCHSLHHALHPLSFTVPAGQRLGLIGQNGAGKSTLLKLLSGVMLPDSGSMSIDGRITGLLELGTGFDSNLSGRRNILTNGLLLGMTAREVAEQEAAIIDFAELGRFIDEPLRTYSSGMVMRLGFAIAIHANPSCFLVDEALSVGDGHFQQKCLRRIRQFRQDGGSIIFVSHDLNAIKQICDRALVLDGGRVVFDGETEGAVNQYNRIMARLDEAESDHLWETRRQQEYGSREVEIAAAALRCPSTGQSLKVLASGQTAAIHVDLNVRQAVEDLSLGFMIRDRFGQDIFGTNTRYLDYDIEASQPGNLHLCLELPFNMSPGQYTLTLAVHSHENHLQHCYHWIDSYLGFEVAGSQVPIFSGAVWMPTQVYAAGEAIKRNTSDAT